MRADGEERRITKLKFSGLFFSALCGFPRLLSVTVLSKSDMVIKELLPYLKYSQSFWTYPIPTYTVLYIFWYCNVCCWESIIGETGRYLKKRIVEHTKRKCEKRHSIVHVWSQCVGSRTGVHMHMLDKEIHKQADTTNLKVHGVTLNSLSSILVMVIFSSFLFHTFEFFSFLCHFKIWFIKCAYLIPACGATDLTTDWTFYFLLWEAKLLPKSLKILDTTVCSLAVIHSQW